MLTKEETLKESIDEIKDSFMLGNGIDFFDGKVSSVYKAMDIYAKQCLMGFQKWCDDCTWHWEMGNQNYKDWDKLSKEQVIDKFLQSQKQ